MRRSIALDAQQSLGFIRTTPFIAVLGAITPSSSGAVWEDFVASCEELNRFISTLLLLTQLLLR